MRVEPGLFAPLVESPAFREIRRRLTEGERRVAILGLVPSARALVLTLLGTIVRRPILVVAADDAAVDGWRRDLAAFAHLTGRDPGRIRTFPALDADPWDGIAPHPEVSRDRVVTLSRLATGRADAVLAPARALLDALPSPGEIASRTRIVRPGDVVAPDAFILWALRGGFRRVDTVSAPGEVGRRGGIIDVFPPDTDEPVRIELFGDTVESLRSFDTDHQRSTRTLEAVVVGPVVENPTTDDGLARLERHLEAGVRRARAREDAVAPFRERIEVLRRAGYFPGIEALAAIMAEHATDLTDHAPGALVVADEPERLDEELVRSAHERRVAYESSEDRVIPPPEELAVAPERVRERLASSDLVLHEILGDAPPGCTAATTIPSRGALSWAGRIAEMAARLRDDGAHGVRTILVARTAGTAQRIAEILPEYGLHPALGTAGPSSFAATAGTGGLFVAVAPLRRGVEFPDQALSLVAEREIFGEETRPGDRKGRGRAAFVSDFRDLGVGDLVVHIDHGVARYAGLGRPKGGSLNRDFMVLQFAGGDRLFVPADRLDLVQKYRGVAGPKPALDRLGGPGWERVKSKARASVAVMAKDLLDLYARRGAAPGRTFAPDGPWQGELEASFPFELTPDQERALREIKRDMESPRPMDRLLVGDVGFGKTEVAVRAAFKAVMDGTQVAILTPTTVLAAQHYETIRDRFAPFPVRVEMVSRFRSPDELGRVVRGLANGEVDLVVGTHRILSKDVIFRRLGLLVVDEEQRFGVAAKERLKKLAVGVDVLAMTATPIPRTLQMSLAGVRDLSVIETPPAGRSAIQTYLLPFRKNVVAQAIRQEMRRDGQVFFVHNRVETIHALARALGDLVPEARVAVAHGQMRERELERVMLRFVHHDADVLLTTTIVENGLDIPRANTIVVNRADRLGLAQLYQLRGRVGRSDQRAYAYFLIPGRHVLTDTARRRLQVLQEFSDLGAGFRLAAADLEIRGAGEFLGAKQHGHIAALGFDLYCRMLERAVQEIQGEVAEERPAAALNLGVDIKIPESYMPEIGDRLALYKRLADAWDPADIDRLQADTEDRYGHLSDAGRNLFDLARLRVVARAAFVKSVDVAEGRLQIRFVGDAAIEPARWVELVEQERGRLTPSGTLVVPAPENALDRIGATRAILERVIRAAAA